MINNQEIHKIAQEFQDAVNSQKLLADKFYKRWGIRHDAITKTLLDSNVQGGLKSKAISLNNIDGDKYSNVIDIGPEVGAEVLMLAQKYPHLYVFDPDTKNLNLIKSIMNRATQKKGKITYIAAGLGNRETMKQEQEYFYMSKKVLKHSDLTYYDVSSSKEISEIKIKADLIFIHKIFSTLSRSSKKSKEEIFNSSLKILKDKLTSGGVISWTEPEFAWRGTKIEKTIYRKIRYIVSGSKERYLQIVYENS